MSKVEAFLSQLQDFELAFLYKYKYPSYLDESQLLIRKEIEKRGLTDDAMKNHVRQYEFNHSNSGCPRCNSLQNISQTVEFNNTNQYTGLDGLAGRTRYTSVVECAVCGWKLSDGNDQADPEPGFFYRLIRVFKRD